MKEWKDYIKEDNSKISLKDHINWFFRDIRNLYYRIKIGISNCIKWFPTIWNDRDYSSYNLLTLMNKKLEFMIEYFEEKEDILSGNEIETLKQAKECVHNLAHKDYEIEAQKTMFGKELNSEEYCNFIKNKEKSKKLYKTFEALKQKDKDKLFKILDKNLDHWWL
jgi:hypothetical protein